MLLIGVLEIVAPDDFRIRSDGQPLESGVILVRNRGLVCRRDHFHPNKVRALVDRELQPAENTPRCTPRNPTSSRVPLVTTSQPPGSNVIVARFTSAGLRGNPGCVSTPRIGGVVSLCS